MCADEFRIAKALPDDSSNRSAKANTVIRGLPVVVSKRLLIEITEQMERFNAHIRSLQPPLQQRPEVLHRVRMNVVTHIFNRVIDDLMLEILRQPLVRAQFIAEDRSASFDVIPDDLLKLLLLARIHCECSDFAIALNDAEGNRLILAASSSNFLLAFLGVHVASLAADKRFINFNAATIAPDLPGALTLKGKPDSMQHEPRGLLSDTERPGHFVGRNAVLAVGDHPHGAEPLIEADRGILEDSPDLNRELALGMMTAALPAILILQERYLLASAPGADNAVRPAALNEELQAIIRIREVNNRFLECLRFAIRHFLSALFFNSGERIGRTGGLVKYIFTQF